MKKKILIIIMILGMLLVISGLFFGVVKMNKKEEQKKQQESTETLPNEDEIFEQITNTNPNIAKEHCLDNLCVTELKIVKADESINIIKGYIKNTTQAPLEASFIDLTFNVDGIPTVQPCYYESIPVGESYVIEIHYENDKLLNVDDYQVSRPTPEQLQKYKTELLG